MWLMLRCRVTGSPGSIGARGGLQRSRARRCLARAASPAPPAAPTSCQRSSGTPAAGTTRSRLTRPRTSWSARPPAARASAAQVDSCVARLAAAASSCSSCLNGASGDAYARLDRMWGNRGNSAFRLDVPRFFNLAVSRRAGGPGAGGAPTAPKRAAAAARAACRPPQQGATPLSCVAPQPRALPAAAARAGSRQLLHACNRPATAP